MAEYRLSYKRGKVGFAGSHAAYILREENYKYKEDLIYKEYGNLPQFSGNNALNFWKAADEFEGVNRNAYREFELNIPNELNNQQAIQLIKEFVNKELGTDFPFTYAIHKSYNEQGQANLHCHLMFSERKLDGIEREKNIFFKKSNSKNPHLGGNKKDRVWKEKTKLLDIRKSWEIFQNNALEKNGFSQRVDCRSLAERRKELLEKGEFEKAESLNRKAVNINGKILIKMKKIGYAKLSLNEKKIVDEYNKAKKEKAKKERRIDIIKGNIIPTKQEILDRLEELNKLDEGAIKRQTVNIITKGKLNKEYFELKKVEKSLIAFPNNEKLLNRKKELEKSLREIVDTHVLTPKYNRILAQLKRDYEREKNQHLDNLKNIYKVYNASLIYEVQKNKNDKENKIKDNLLEKYRDKSVLELSYKLHELNNISSEYKAIQVLSQYRLDNLLHSNYKNSKELLKNKEELKQHQLFNNTEKIKELTNKINKLEEKISFNSKEHEKIIESLNKKSEQVAELTNKINANTELEKSIIQKLLKEKEQENSKLSNFEKHKQLIAQNLQLMSDLEKSKKLHNYFSNKNDNEKYNKSLFYLENRIDAITNTINSKANDLSNINNIDKKIIFKELKEQHQNIVSKSEKNIEKLEKAAENIKDILSKDKVLHGLNEVELITLNKVTKGEFYKNHCKLVKVEDEFEKLTQKYQNSNFIKKALMNNELKQKERELNILKTQENTMIKENISTQLFKDKVILTKEHFEKSLNKVNKGLKENKAEKSNSLNILKSLKNVEEKQERKHKDIERNPISKNLKNINLNNISKFSYDLQKTLQTEQQNNYNNLEIKLENERGIL